LLPVSTAAAADPVRVRLDTSEGVIVIELETRRAPLTSSTGLAHVDGTVSMACNAPGTAMGEFFITGGPAPYLTPAPAMSATPRSAASSRAWPSFARSLAAPAHPGGWSKATRGQSIVTPVRIRTARRVG
jgi:peptidyl-prolyl cis-trans isomerase A (cyclophilin A)